MIKFLGMTALFLLPSLSQAADLDRVVALQQALLIKQQVLINSLQPIYLSDIEFTLTQAHSWKRDGAIWLKEPGFTLSDGTFYSKGVQIHPPDQGKVTLEVAVPRDHPVFSVILADITPSDFSDYTYRFFVKKAGTITSIGTPLKRTLKTRVEFGVGNADSLIVEVDANGTNLADHAALVDAKFIR